MLNITHSRIINDCRRKIRGIDRERDLTTSHEDKGKGTWKRRGFLRGHNHCHTCSLCSSSFHSFLLYYYNFNTHYYYCCCCQSIILFPFSKGTLICENLLLLLLVLVPIEFRCEYLGTLVNGLFFEGPGRLTSPTLSDMDYSNVTVINLIVFRSTRSF